MVMLLLMSFINCLFLVELVNCWILVLYRNPKIVGIYRLIMKSGSDNLRVSAIQSIIEKIRVKGVEVQI